MLDISNKSDKFSHFYFSCFTYLQCGCNAVKLMHCHSKQLSKTTFPFNSVLLAVIVVLNELVTTFVQVFKF